MDSLSVVKNPFRILQLSGVWYPIEPSNFVRYLFSLWTLVNVFVFNIAFTLIEVSNTFYTNSIDEMVDHLMITSTIFVTILKAINVLLHRKSILELFDLIRELDNDVESMHRKIFIPVLKISKFLFYAFLISYLCSLSLVFLQTIFSEPQDRLYSSTHFYSNEVLHVPSIYNGVLIFQMIANGSSCFMDIGLDVYGIILIFVLCGHIDVLRKQFLSLGSEAGEMMSCNIMRKLCRRYETVLR